MADSKLSAFPPVLDALRTDTLLYVVTTGPFTSHSVAYEEIFGCIGHLTALAASMTADASFGIVQSPAGLRQSRKVTIQQVYDHIGVLSGTAAMTTADVVPAFQVGGTVGGTVQQLYNVINVLTGAGALTTADKLPAFNGGTGKAATVQQVMDAVNVLTGAGALTTADKFVAFNGGTAKAATTQQLYNAINVLAAGAAVSGTDLLAAYQATGVKVTAAQLLTYIQNNISTFLNLNGSAFTIVGGNANSTTNGTNLVAAYAAAKVATPHGAALSINNRFTIFLLPGRFIVTGDALVMDTAFIDIVGLSTNSGSRNWTSLGLAGLDGGDTIIQSTGNTLGVSAGSDTDVCIQNVALITSGAGNVAFNPSVAGIKLKVVNCFMLNTSAQTNPGMQLNIDFAGYYEDVRCWNSQSFGFRLAGTATASGTFIRCKAGDFAFGDSITDGTNGNATGLFIDCEADGASFGRNLASGVFIRCRFVNVVGTSAGMFGYGTTAGDASGTFIECQSNNSSSFGAFNSSGTFRYCRGQGPAFGCFGTANGLFEWCSCVGAAGTNSFGSTSSGVFRHCEVTGASGAGFGVNATASGTYEHCATTGHGFAGSSTTGGTFSGTARYCTTGGSGFGMGLTGAGTLSGKIENCAVVAHALVTLTGKITNMRIEAVAANTTALQIGSGSTGAIYDCTLIGTGSGLSIDVISGTPTIVIAHCRLNKGIGASVTNSVTTPYNVDQSVIV